jgi:hypothetical protein
MQSKSHKQKKHDFYDCLDPTASPALGDSPLAVKSHTTTSQAITTAFHVALKPIVIEAAVQLFRRLLGSISHIAGS